MKFAIKSLKNITKMYKQKFNKKVPLEQSKFDKITVPHVE